MFIDFLFNSEKERCINLYGKVTKNVFETIEENVDLYKNNTYNEADELTYDESKVELWSSKYLKAIFVINEDIMNGVDFMDEKIVYMENIHKPMEVEKELTKQEKENNQLDANKDLPTFQNMLDLAKEKCYSDGYDRGCCMVS